ncbi:hypothetical protein [Neptunomonas qingdaonensis]|uniref:Porin n=1 Tax=Neptunomonas qingdaonensis TaxID=1045558 RepID=A0A1I2RID4_9GAMM|nr:hypothetical protein [Neptunomonas qingdaonensis]SFG40272.1 hypothetical protein SAMN05216175_106128 [Neptunomonas qingdaonensis]
MSLLRSSHVQHGIKLTSMGLILACSSQVHASAEFEASGKVTAELRLFSENPQYADQYQDANLSIAVEPDFFWQWNDALDSLSFKPFFRLDQHDNERTHADIRELSWVHQGDDWELRSGIRKVFWGVTEFQHLVDVINQSDGIEDIDGEDKLGQPMINLSLVKSWGIVDLYLLPGFREQTFPGKKGRLRSSLVVDTDQAQFEAGNEAMHTDLAIRWSQSVGDFDLGAHWFRGTNRDPILEMGMKGSEMVLVPYYEQMNQVGFDLQATIESWLWKAETIWRNSESDTYWAAQAGFEYTFYGIQESYADLGVLLEYGWDQRGKKTKAIFQNDISVGARLALNDTASTELLAGVIYDVDYGSTSLQLEASRRLGDKWKITLDGRFFSADDSADMMSSMDKDDHIQIGVERYF